MPYTSTKPSHHVARVSKAPIVACLTCPLCGNLFREATTISECLHTFCKECIHERFNDEETNSCPMCNVSLGCVPLEKLRADPQMDDVQAKIFNFNPKKRPAASASPPASTHAPARRKERSLSSLGVVSMPSTSKSRKARQRTWVNKDSSDSEEEEQEENNDDDDDDDTQEQAESQENGMYCSETLDSDSKSVERVLLDSRAENELSGAKRSKLSRTSSGGNRESPKQLDPDFLSPLACLAELADADEKHSTRGSKAARSSSPCLPVKEEEEEEETRDNRRSVKESSSLRATKNVRRSSQGKSASRKNGSTAAPVVQQTSNGLWFTLKSATSQGEDGGFPQITTPYLRIKDGKLPVSYVRKYLVKKLDLKSESEVEITCRGQPVVSSLPLESVRKIWLAKDSPASQRGGLNHQPGASGKEFLMVLTYGRNRRTMLN